MIQKLTPHGDALALVIDASILARLGINAETPLNLMVQGDALVVSPVDAADRPVRFENALKSVNERYGDTLKRLAD